MAVNLSMLAGAGAQFFDNNGTPLTGGKLYTYLAGTTTPQAAYTTIAGNVTHTNPIVLDSAGRVPSGGEIWLADALKYKFVSTNSNDVIIGTYDDITGNGSNVFSAFAAPNGSSLVSFLQAGVNAQPRTVQSKLRDVISVKDFGAVGNGNADDTLAVQAAINAAIAGDKVLSLANGTYSITSKLLVSGSVTIQDGTLIAPNWTGNRNSGVDYFLEIAANNCTIQRVKIDTYMLAAMGINSVGNNNEILNCEITRVYQFAIRVIDSYGTLIDGNRIYNIGDIADPSPGSNGIFLGGNVRFATKNTTITNNHITDINWAGAPEAPGLDGNCIQIQGSLAGTIDNGNPNDARATITNTIIANNYLARCNTRCVKMQDSYITVTGNVMEDAQQGAAINGGTAIANIVISDNLIKNTIFGSVTGDSTVLNLVVSGNVFQNLKREFIVPQSGGCIQNAVIDGNIVYVAQDSVRGLLFGYGATVRPSGSDKNITISNNQFFNVGPQTEDPTADFNRIAIIYSNAKNISFLGNTFQSRNRVTNVGLFRVNSGAENIQFINNTMLLGSNQFPYLFTGGASIMLKGETSPVKKIIRGVSIPSGSTSISVTHDLGVSFAAANVIGQLGITGTDNNVRAWFQKFTLIPKNNPTNNVTYTVAPSTATAALVTLSGDPGASGFTFDLVVDLEIDGELIPTSI